MPVTPHHSIAKEQGKNIFLVGFMGSGKTYWGKLWAQEAGLDFYDLDHMIEEAEGKTVAAIFENEGEDFFRQREKEMIRSFAAKKNCIVATGGGTPCLNDNMEWMNGHGTTVYLSATPAYICERVMPERAQRPLLKAVSEARLLFFIEQKLGQREGVYRQAQIILPVEELSVSTIKKIIDT